MSRYPGPRGDRDGDTADNDFDAGPANELARRNPEDPEGSPWPAIAVVATVLGAAAAAWWCA